MDKKHSRKCYILLGIHCFPLKERNEVLAIYTEEVSSLGAVL